MYAPSSEERAAIWRSFGTERGIHVAHRTRLQFGDAIGAQKFRRRMRAHEQRGQFSQADSHVRLAIVRRALPDTVVRLE